MGRPQCGRDRLGHHRVHGRPPPRLPDVALLMAIFKAGLDGEELAAWVDAMLHSGDTLDFSHVAAPKVTSTRPAGWRQGEHRPRAMAAACGVAVPMMSGRALGHTGGTLDKLETIPGFRTALDPPEFREILARTNLVLAGQSETLVPADRRLYALRDATGTVGVDTPHLVLDHVQEAGGRLDALVLDVKVGRGAFIKDPGQARVLAETMVGIGASHGVPVRSGAHRHEPAPGPRGGQRLRGSRGGRGAARERARRPGRGHLPAMRGDAPGRRRLHRPGGRRARSSGRSPRRCPGQAGGGGRGPGRRPRGHPRPVTPRPGP